MQYYRFLGPTNIKEKMKLKHSHFLTILFIGRAATMCTFPSEISGYWLSAFKSHTLLFNSSYVYDYPMRMSNTVNSLDFYCQDKSGTKYLLKSTETVFVFQTYIEAYLCIDLRRISATKYYYYIQTTLSPTNNEYVYGARNGTIVTMADACNRNGNYKKDFIVLVKNESISDGVSPATCPDVLLASYSAVTITDAAGSSTCSGNTMDACSDKEAINYTLQSCATSRVFTSGGRFQCLHTITSSDVSYVALWNTDAAVDGTSTYRFTCMAVSKSGSGLQATEYPNFCKEDSQTSSSVSSPGIKISFQTATKTCVVSVTSVSSPGWIVLIVVLSLLALAAIAVVIVLVVRPQTRKQISSLSLSKIG